MTEKKYICSSKIYYCFKFISFVFKANKKILFFKKKIKKIKSGQIWPNLAKTAIWPDLARFGQIWPDFIFFNFVEKKIKTIPGRNPAGKKSGHLQIFSCVEIIQVGKKPGRSMDFFSSSKRNGKRNENPDGKKSGHLQIFFGGNHPGGKKKPGRSMDFFSSSKRNGKRNENPDGKNLDIFNFFLVEIIQVEKKTWKI